MPHKSAPLLFYKLMVHIVFTGTGGSLVIGGVTLTMYHQAIGNEKILKNKSSFVYTEDIPYVQAISFICNLTGFVATSVGTGKGSICE